MVGYWDVREQYIAFFRGRCCRLDFGMGIQFVADRNSKVVGDSLP